jgi:DNA-binding response OmpR family regulator
MATFTTAQQDRLRTTRLLQPAHGRGDPPHTSRSAVEMVLIDESPTDVDLFRRALNTCALPCSLTVLWQWSDVAAFVRQAATSPSHCSPRLIIAEAWIPGMAVEELLVAVRAVPAYAAVPAVLFSALPEEEGRQRGAQCGATGFVHKPSEWRAFVAAVAMIVRRWVGGSDEAALATAARGAD